MAMEIGYYPPHFNTIDPWIFIVGEPTTPMPSSSPITIIPTTIALAIANESFSAADLCRSIQGDVDIQSVNKSLHSLQEEEWLEKKDSGIEKWIMGPRLEDMLQNRREPNREVMVEYLPDVKLSSDDL